jgi:hypothetical protein
MVEHRTHRDKPTTSSHPRPILARMFLSVAREPSITVSMRIRAIEMSRRASCLMQRIDLIPPSASTLRESSRVATGHKVELTDVAITQNPGHHQDQLQGLSANRSNVISWSARSPASPPCLELHEMHPNVQQHCTWSTTMRRDIMHFDWECDGREKDEVRSKSIDGREVGESALVSARLGSDNCILVLRQPNQRLTASTVVLPT